MHSFIFFKNFGTYVTVEAAPLPPQAACHSVKSCADCQHASPGVTCDIPYCYTFKSSAIVCCCSK